MTKSALADRMDLYKRGFTDREMASRLGISPSGVGTWRHRRGLPPNRKRRKSPPWSGGYGGVPMAKALTPEQCAVMTKFLGDLLRAADTQLGEKPDVMAFMWEWRKLYE